MKSLGFGSLALAVSLVPSMAGAQGAPVPSSKIDEAAGAAAAAAAADRAPVEVFHDHAPPPQAVDHVLTYDYRNADKGGVTYQGRWTGTWTGHYEGQPTQVYNGTYDGRYGGSAPGWAHRDHRDQRHMAYYGGPVYGYGYGWAGPVMTTIIIQSAPIITTTTTTTEEVIYGAAPRKRIARRSWKPRPKQRCAC